MEVLGGNRGRVKGGKGEVQGGKRQSIMVGKGGRVKGGKRGRLWWVEVEGYCEKRGGFRGWENGRVMGG